jgi:methionyl-tRNA synthetase
MFNYLLKENYIYKGKYEGNYCKYDEEFFTESQLAPGKTCPNCKRPTIILSEDSYFLKINKFQD